MSGTSAIAPPVETQASFEVEVANCLAEVGHDRSVFREARAQIEERRIKAAEEINDAAYVVKAAGVVATSVLEVEGLGGASKLLEEQVGYAFEALSKQAGELRAAHPGDEDGASVRERLSHLKARSRG